MVRREDGMVLIVILSNPHSLSAFPPFVPSILNAISGLTAQANHIKVSSPENIVQWFWNIF